jgi:hypothetical protein
MAQSLGEMTETWNRLAHQLQGATQVVVNAPAASAMAMGNLNQVRDIVTQMVGTGERLRVVRGWVERLKR